MVKEDRTAFKSGKTELGGARYTFLDKNDPMLGFFDMCLDDTCTGPAYLESAQRDLG